MGYAFAQLLIGAGKSMLAIAIMNNYYKSWNKKFNKLGRANC